MTTSLIGFFLDTPSANDAIGQLQAAGYDASAREGEQFDSKWQQGRIAVVVAGSEDADPGQEAELRAILLRAGALDVQDGDAKGDSATSADTLNQDIHSRTRI